MLILLCFVWDFNSQSRAADVSDCKAGADLLDIIRRKVCLLLWTWCIESNNPLSSFVWTIWLCTILRWSVFLCIASTLDFIVASSCIYNGFIRFHLLELLFSFCFFSTEWFTKDLSLVLIFMLNQLVVFDQKINNVN